MDPDVIIVVGGKEFREFSQSLCCWSSYFDGAFRSGMKEAVRKRFEFPDRDPDEWQWILSLMAPLSSEKITKDNALKALSWFDLLCVDRGLAHCDKLLEAEVSSRSGTSRSCRHIDRILDVLEASVYYSLPLSKAACFKFFKAPSLEELTLLQMERLMSSFKVDRDCRESLWSSLEQSIPNSTREKVVMESEEELPETVSIPLHEFLFIQMKLKKCTSGTPKRPAQPKKRGFLSDSSSSEEESSDEEQETFQRPTK